MKLFSSILKQKRTMTLVLLFLVVVGVVIPYVALADWNPLCWEWLWGESEPGGFYGNYCYFSGQNNQAVLDKLGDPIKAVFTGMILAVATIMIVVAGSLATLASNLFSTILGASTTMCYTCFDNPAIAAGWPMVRDLANMFIVLGFVVIGIATTLRIQEYQAKKTLFPLIIAALLINFSLLITGVFIDASNIAMTSFSKGGGFLATSAIGNISNQTSAIWNNWDPNQSTNAIGTAVGIVFYDIVLFVVFMLFFFLFLFRYIALWILVILSPLAFVCWVFPFTKKFFEKWWSNFLGWCIIGIPAGLFLWISDKIASNFISNNPGVNLAGIAILGYLVPAMFLIAGFLFSLQISAMGASMAIGAFKKTGKFAGAGAAKLTSLAADKSGATRGLSAMKSGATRMGERIGLVKPGTDAANQQFRLSDKNRMNRINSMTPEDMVREIQAPRSGHEGSLDRAAMVKKLAENNQLNMLPAAQRQAAIAQAVNSGVRSKDLIGGLESGDIANAINNPAAHPQYNAETLATGFKALTKRNDLDLINPGQRQTAFDNAIQHGARPEEIEKSDYHYAIKNEARRQRIRTANPTFNSAQIDDAAINQALDENITSMSYQQLSNIDAAHLTPRRIDRLTPDKINAFEFAPRASRRAIKSAFTATGQLFIDYQNAFNEYRAASTAIPPNTARATNRYVEVRRLQSLLSAAGRLNS